MKSRHIRARFVSDLLEQLPAFGLDPRDWSIHRTPILAKVEMRHRDDHELKIEAWVSPILNGKLRVRTLTLASW